MGVRVVGKEGQCVQRVGASMGEGWKRNIFHFKSFLSEF